MNRRETRLFSTGSAFRVERWNKRTFTCYPFVFLIPWAISCKIHLKDNIGTRPEATGAPEKESENSGVIINNNNNRNQKK